MKRLFKNYGLWFLILFLVVSFGTVEQFKIGKAELSKAKSVIASGKSIITGFKSLIDGGNPGQLIQGVVDMIAIFAPGIMKFVGGINFVALFAPDAESAELKAIREGFEQVNRKLDSLTSDVANLDSIIQLSAARSAYATTVTAINANYENMQEAYKENNKDGFMFFIRQYDNSYNLAADNLYDTMIGSSGPFGFNLLNLYKTHVRCNPVAVAKFCAMGLNLISKGMSVEGAYLGAQNMSASVDAKIDKWKNRIQQLGDQCKAIVKNCEDDWKNIAKQQFLELYNKYLSDDNQAFATKIASGLAEIMPQRSWLAVASTHAHKNGEISYSSSYDSEEIWDKSNHDVTIFSTKKAATLEGDAYKNFVKPIDEAKAKIGRINNCIASEIWVIKNSRYSYNEARTMVNIVREKFQNGVVYVVRTDKNPGQHAVGNTIYASDQKWNCNSEPFRIIAFQ